MCENKINIALLADAYGGKATSVNDLILCLNKNRFNPIFIFLTGNKFPENHFQQAGYKVIYLSGRDHVATFSPFVILRLAKVLRENRIDILHSRCHKTTFIGTSAAMLAGTPVVLAFVRGLNRTRTLRRKLANFFLFKKINKIIPISQSVKDDVLKSNWFVDADKLFILGNSIDYERFANAGTTKLEARRLLGFSEDDFLFGTVGRLAPTKGVTYLLDAFAKVGNLIPNAHLVLIGDGYARAELESYAIKTGCASSIHFLGRKNNIEKLLKGFDVFVLASIAEGMPRAVLEAMAAGVPCVATEVGGLPEIIESSNTGILVPAKDPDSLAEAMKTLANMPAQGLEKIVKNAQNRVREVYSHEVVVEKLKNLYEAEFQKISADELCRK